MGTADAPDRGSHMIRSAPGSLIDLCCLQISFCFAVSHPCDGEPHCFYMKEMTLSFKSWEAFDFSDSHSFWSLLMKCPAAWCGALIWDQLLGLNIIRETTWLLLDQWTRVATKIVQKVGEETALSVLKCKYWMFKYKKDRTNWYFGQFRPLLFTFQCILLY